MIRKKISRALCMLLSVVMCLQLVAPSVAATSEEAETDSFPEIELALETGEVSFAASSGTVDENAGHGTALRIVRGGDASEAATVRVSMLDETAVYGTDYKVEVVGASVQNEDSAQSMLGILTSDEEQYEYNYSDAVADGSALQESAEGSEALTEEESAQMAAELVEELTGDDEATIETVSSNGASEETAPETEKESEAKTAADLGAAAEEAVVTTKEPTTLREKMEASTGVVSDREPMTTETTDTISSLPYLSDSREELIDEMDSAYVDITFAAGVSERSIVIVPIDNASGDGDRTTLFSLSSDALTVDDEGATFTLTVKEDEEVASPVLSFTEESYSADGGSITVEVTRTGSLIDTIQATISTTDGTAKAGREYSCVSADIVFPFGVSERHVTIPIRSDYIEQDADFSIHLSDPVGCELSGISEAVCVISPDDESTTILDDGDFDVSLSSDTYTDTSEEIDDALDLKSLATKISISGSGHSYMSSDGTYYEIYATGNKWGTATTKTSFITEDHYDYAGYRILWTRAAGKPTWGGTKCIFLSAVDGATDSYDEDTKYNGDTERWDSDTDNYYASTLKTNGMRFELKRTGGWTSTSPTLKLYSVCPIYRPFIISLKGADTVNLLNANGSSVSASEISAYKNSCDVLLENASNTGLGSLTTHTDTSITLSLDHQTNPIVYISGARFVSSDGTKSYTALSNLAVGTKAASIEITSELISALQANGIISYRESSADKLRTGSFSVQPILANIPAQVTVESSSHGSLEVSPVSGSADSSGAMKYSCNLGDTLTFTANVTDNTYEWSGIRVSGSGIQSCIYTPTDGKVQLSVPCTDLVVTPIFTERQNAVVVRIPTEYVSHLDTSRGGIGAMTGVAKDGYTEYTICSTDTHTFTAYDTVSVEAYPRYSTEVPVWQSAGSTTSYSQNKFWLTTSSEPEDNVITLKFLTADSVPYSISATAYSEDQLDSTAASVTAWQSITGALLMIDTTHYGISMDTGKIQTMLFNGVSGCSVKFLCEASGTDEYGEVMLSSGELTTDDTFSEQNVSEYYNLDVGSIVFSARTAGAPYVESVTATSEDSVTSSRLTMGTNVYTLSAVINYNGYDGTTGQPYYDSDGTLRYEKVTAVDFLVVDPQTHEVRSTISGAVSDDGVHWTCAAAFVTGSEDYKSSDLIYARVTTDRVIGNGRDADTGAEVEAFANTVYASLNTGLYLVEANPTATVEYSYDPDIGTDYYSLPIIGSLMMNIRIAKFNFGIEQIANGVRLAFGYCPVVKRQDNAQSDTADTGTSSYNLTVGSMSALLDSFKEPFNDMTEMVNTFGSKNAIGAMSLGIPVWSISPCLGIYIDFGISSTTYEGDADNEKTVQTNYSLLGAGAYIGAVGNFKYTYYMVVYGIPFYVGGEVSLSILAEMGAEADENTTMNEIFTGEKSLNDMHFDFTFRAILNASAYAGVGLCGTAGVRGGFQLSFYYIANPTIQEQYPSFHKQGFRISAAIKVWVDALLFSIPIPAYSFDDLNWGYFEDVANNNADNESLLEASLMDSADTTATLKERTSQNSEWLGSENSDEAALSSTFSPVSEPEELLKDGYDAPDQKLLELSDGRVLMLFLNDDSSRTDEERTALYWTIYENGAWTLPKLVQNDGTGDFDPAMTRLDDEGHVMIAWVSCDPESTDDHDEMDAALKDTEIYSVVFDTNNYTFGEIQQLTQDENYYSGVDLISDEAGNAVLYYYANEIDETESVVDSINLARNNSYLMYMIYSDDAWDLKSYCDSELAGMTQAEAVKLLGGQHFVNTANEEAGQTDPNVIDFTVSVGQLPNITDDMQTKWNSLYEQILAASDEQTQEKLTAELKTLLANASSYSAALIAYTIDADNDLGTNDDRDLYIQSYNFETHETSAPVRITDDEICDSNPQLVSCGKPGLAVTSDTYLFWLKDGSSLYYYNILEYYTEKLMASKVGDPELADIRDESGDLAAINSYRAFVDDEENLFVAVQQGDVDGGVNLYLTGYAKDSESGAAWSDLAQMSSTENIENELPVFATVNGKDLLMVHNRFTVDYSGEEYAVKNPCLVSTLFSTVSSLAATDVSISATPVKAGDQFTANVTLRNTGVKRAKGFTGSVNLTMNDKVIAELTDIDVSDYLIAGDQMTIAIPVTLPEAAVGHLSELGLSFNLSEKATKTSCESQIKLFQTGPEYSVTDVDISQNGDDFVVTGTLTNTGDLPSEDNDYVIISYENAYNQANTGTDTFAKENVKTLAGGSAIDPGDSFQFSLTLDIPDSRLKTGYCTAYIDIMSGNDEYRSEGKSIVISPSYPFGLTADCGSTVTLHEGDTLQLTGSYADCNLFGGGKIEWASADSSVAQVSSSGLLKAVGEGTTEIQMQVNPYGGYGSITVKVTNNSSVFEDVSNPDAYYYDAVNWAAEKKIAYGEDATHFVPNGTATRAQMITFLWRAAGRPEATETVCRFTDVNKNAYYYKAVLWAMENGITAGTTETTFSPNELVTRAQVVTFMARMVGVTGDTADYTEPFTDVKDTDYFSKAVAWAYQNKVTAGTTATTFSPNESCTRAQVVSFLYRYYVKNK